MFDSNDLQHDADALRSPCAQDAPESPATALANRPRRSGYFDNRNAMRHGLKASALPKGAGWIHRDVKGFRRAIEDAVVSVHGSVSITQAAAINTACRAEIHAQLAARWLRDQIDQLDATQRLNYSAAVVKASEQRDKALATLGIDKNTLSAWDRLQGVIDAAPQQNATAGVSVAQEGNQQ